jgi:hypothetical protein
MAWCVIKRTGNFAFTLVCRKLRKLRNSSKLISFRYVSTNGMCELHNPVLCGTKKQKEVGVVRAVEGWGWVAEGGRWKTAEFRALLRVPVNNMDAPPINREGTYDQRVGLSSELK